MKLASKLIAIFTVVFAFSCLISLYVTYDAEASIRVKGYYRKDGTYVRPHYRSSPDSSITNNWSYCGNVNPYTGKVGSVGCSGTLPTTNYGGSSDSSSDTSDFSQWLTNTPPTTLPNKNTTPLPNKYDRDYSYETDKLSYVTIGSTKEDVLRIMGEPDQKLSSSYSYGYSSIYFDTNSKVSGWSNIGDIKIKASIGEKKKDAKPFTLGSTVQDVVDAMGTPDGIIGPNFTYGYSSVFFGIDGKVSGWSQISNKLNMTLGEKKINSEGFNVGSTKQEVIDAMGTPQTLIGDTYSYGYSSVYFINGKVYYYSNIGNNLNIKSNK